MLDLNKCSNDTFMPHKTLGWPISTSITEKQETFLMNTKARTIGAGLNTQGKVIIFFVLKQQKNMIMKFFI